MAHIYRNPATATPITPTSPVILTSLASTTVSADNTPKQLLAANLSRKFVMISNGYNGDTVGFSLYVKFGAGATTSSYSFLLAPGYTWESGPIIYQGVITCTLGSAGPNNVQVSEGI